MLARLKTLGLDLLFNQRLLYAHALPFLNRHVLWPIVTGGGRAVGFRESMLAHRWLDGLHGLEVGPSVSNGFGLPTRNVGRRDKIYEREQLQAVGCFAPLHIEANADALPVPDGSQDFVLSSHVVEHCPDLIGTLREWFRVIRVNGILFIIAPHRDAAPSDVGRPLTTWETLVDLHHRRVTDADLADQGVAGHCHYHVFSPTTLKSFIEQIFGAALVLVEEQERDDKVGNGFTLVYRKTAAEPAST
ncbi:MAG: class I SAM-dependent methyltransferase [Deltaproteobacteria bacterium]|nr:class I SAM-dependent methyltransferase [Deltaproteobacteria bacterium]